MRTIHCIALAATLLAAACAAPPPEPFGPVPSSSQLAWQRMETNMFCHFGPNTFSGAEWGSGDEAEDMFNPASIDCGQWVDVAAEAGFGGIIVTAKHHDGFCLWPSGQSAHTVAQSRWMEGKGDVLRLLRDAIDAHNGSQAACGRKVRMGVYISPWDRNHPAYGTDTYNQVFANTLREVHSQYGPMFEQWFDGACGEGPGGKRQVYDWPMFMQTVADLNPQCVVFSDIGPGCRWVGNEEGRAGTTCWSTLRTDGATPSENKPAPDELVTGHRDGDKWVPAEVDVSLRPGWFWHPGEEPKTVEQLVDIYLTSVGRNGLLLLNVPPDTNGRICAADSARLVAWRAEIDRIFARDLAGGATARGRHLRGRRYSAQNALDTAYHTYWAAADSVASVTIDFGSEATFDLVVLQEYIPLGQRVCRVELHCQEADGHWMPALPDDAPLCTTVGYKRIVSLPSAVTARRVRLDFVGLAAPVINRIAFYNSAQ